MELSSLKSQSRSTVGFKTPIAKINLIDRDIEIEKEYLQKLKLQRNKTEKLYAEYIDLMKERQNMKHQIQQLQRQLQQYRSKATRAGQDSKAELRRLQIENQSYQLEIKRLTTEKMMQSRHVQEQYAHKMKDLEEQVTYFRDLQAEKKLRRNQMEEKVAKAKRANLKLISQNDALKLKIKNIETRYEQNLTKHQMQRESFEKREAMLEQQRRQLQLSLSDKNDQLETFKSQYESTRAKEKSYADIYNEFQQSKNFWNYRIEQKKAEIEELQRMIEDYRQRVQSLQSKNTLLQRELREKEDRQRRCRRECDELSQKCRRQEEEVLQVQQKLLQMNQEMSSNDLLMQKLKQRVADLKEENNVYIRLFEQKREIQFERRELVQNELEQVDKFERLLKDII